jgi:hypothetical protein
MVIFEISKPFVVGFLAGMSLFVAANLYSYTQMKELEIDDYLSEFGWPFPLYQSGTILHLDEIHWCGLVADISIAIFASLIIGQICAVVSERRSIREG